MTAVENIEEDLGIKLPVVLTPTDPLHASLNLPYLSETNEMERLTTPSLTPIFKASRNAASTKINISVLKHTRDASPDAPNYAQVAAQLCDKLGIE